ncbi:MAG: glycosyltransferase [Actinomycetota bacterium]|nr:glycosyltransferase [Actinomycetota bacterium]
MATPEITVVIPTRNRATSLRQALQSVLWQQNVALEVIVVDDASIDDTRRMVVGLEEPRIRLIRHEQSRGVSAARNHGAREASGAWLGFLDDDDVWAPEKLARQIAAAEASGRSWVYAGWVTIDDHLQVLTGRPPPSPDQVVKLLYRLNAIPTGGSNVIVRRDTFEETNGFDPRLTNGEDWELWIRLADTSPPEWVPEPLVAYRIHPGNASLDTSAVWTAVAMIERRHGVTVDRGSIERWIAESHLRTGRRTLAVTHLALAAVHGHGRDVARDLLTALKRQLYRGLGHRSQTLGLASDAAWSSQAQSWLDGLATPPPSAPL